MRKSPDTINFNHFKEFSIKEILTAKSESIRPRCLQARTNHQSSIAKWEKFHHVQNLPSSPWWRSVLNIRNVLDRSWRTGNWRRPHLRLLRHGDRFHRSTSHTKLLAWNIYYIAGSTSVLHDSEGPMNVGHCTDPGCYSRAINYNASQRQIGALAELSEECHQSIQVNLFTYYTQLIRMT